MITDAQNKRVEIFTPTGNSLTRWGLGKFFGPCGIAVCPNSNIIVTDIAEHTVSIYQVNIHATNYRLIQCVNLYLREKADPTKY